MNIDIIDAKGLARLAGLSQFGILHHARCGHIESIFLGGRYIFSRSAARRIPAQVSRWRVAERARPGETRLERKCPDRGPTSQGVMKETKLMRIVLSNYPLSSWGVFEREDSGASGGSGTSKMEELENPFILSFMPKVIRDFSTSFHTTYQDAAPETLSLPLLTVARVVLQL